MSAYIATFFTHYDAMQFKRHLEGIGVEGVMSPVPRWLSSSCGTCVRFSMEEDRADDLPTDDLERLVLVQGEKHRNIVDNS